MAGRRFKLPKIIKVETISDSISYPLVRVTFRGPLGTDFFGDMSPNELKIRRFEYKMRSKLTSKEWDELQECFNIKYKDRGEVLS